MFRKNLLLRSRQSILSIGFLFTVFMAFVYSTTVYAQDKNYFVKSKGYGTAHFPDPPPYVRTLSDTNIDAFKNLYWIETGIDYRTRFEMRDSDLRRSENTVDYPILSRTRVYFGVKEIADPFRFTVEFEDARLSNSKFNATNREVNENEFIQAYGELFFENVLGENAPIRLRAGRMAFEELDRKMFARNPWRNTTNTFQGFRASFGQQSNSWEVDTFALQPLVRKLEKTDHRRKDQWFYGVVGSWRKWSDIITIQPYYFHLAQDTSDGLIERDIYAPGLRMYGIIHDSNWDYDTNVTYQFGESGNGDHRALGLITEIGYSFDHSWKPRLSVFYGYGSGDKDPNDLDNERLERFFGAGRPWSNDNYFVWENLHAVRPRLEFSPCKSMQIDIGYSWYWLASDTDRWSSTDLRDTSGNSGSFLGQQFDIRARNILTNRINSNIGFTHFIPGKFTEATRRDEASDFFYVELSFCLFE